MVTSHLFSNEQENRIRTIVREELVPIKVKLLEHDGRLERIEERLEDMPTKSWLLDTLDHYFGRLEIISHEVASLTKSSIRHHSQLEKHSKEIRVLKMKIR